MWWISCLLPQREDLGSIFKSHLLRLSGIGRVTVLAVRRKKFRPAQSPYNTHFHTLLTTTIYQSFWLDKWLLQLVTVDSLDHSLDILLHWTFSVLLVMFATEDFTFPTNLTKWWSVAIAGNSLQLSQITIFPLECVTFPTDHQLPFWFLMRNMHSLCIQRLNIFTPTERTVTEFPRDIQEECLVLI